MRPKIYPADEHEIDPSHIDPDAMFVLRRLSEAGYLAYLVGGGVRDLLAKKRPKDFDISTSATPEEIKQVFKRQCILIGKRFRLAHVRFGRKIIEVSTFRSGESDSELIVRDNKWGTPEEDVLRRDFTINGLFLDPIEHHVIDYVGGWKDIHEGVICSIGDPVVRFHQDPVRMLRLVKFRARFDFKIDPETEKGLFACRDEIIKSSPARILEELLRMLESGASEQFFKLMKEYKLLESLLPWLEHYIDRWDGSEIWDLLRAADSLNNSAPKRKPVDRSVLCACLIFPIVDREIRSKLLQNGHQPHLGQIAELIQTLVDGVAHSSFTHFPKRLVSQICLVLITQYRFNPLGDRPVRKRIVPLSEFNLPLAFLKLRTLNASNLVPTYRVWKDLYLRELENAKERGEGDSKPKRRRSRPRRRKPSPQGE